MQYSDYEIAQKYRRAENKTKEIALLAELNGCSKDDIKEILLREGQELPKKRTRKASNEPKKVPAQKPTPTEETTLQEAVTESQTYLPNDTIEGAITGGEGDVEGYEPTEKKEFKEAELVEIKVKDQEESRSDLPESVKRLIKQRIKELADIVKMAEKERDELCDVLGGTYTNE